MHWIFFDAVGTLFGIRGSVGAQYVRAAQMFGGGADPALVQQVFQEVFDASPPMVGPVGTRCDEFERQWWKNLVREVCRRSGMALDLDAFFEYLFQMFASARCWQLYPDVSATLKLLACNGCRLGIISNFDYRLSPLLEDLGLKRWITQVTTSGNAGAAKPASRIFLAACEKAGIPPEEALHIGDSLPDDYQAARNAGLQAVLLDRENLHREFAGHRVRRLSSLSSLIEK